MSSFVYIVACADGSLYTGWTTDLSRRVRAHNEGRGAKYTGSRRPVRLVFSKELPSKREAMRWEYFIKRLPRKQKMMLVTGRMQVPANLPDREEDARQRGDREKMGKIFYLMGKSASGKDNIYARLLKDPRLKELDLRPLVIYTTRPMRTGETDGVNYRFTDEAGMERLEEKGCVIEKRCYETVMGPWYYFTVDDENTDLSAHNYLAIGTPAAYKKIRQYYGKDHVEGLYVETEDGLRLRRALEREAGQDTPHYEEMCRRFLADQKDFSESRLKRAGAMHRFSNNGTLEACVEEIISFMLPEQPAPEHDVSGEQ